MLLTFFRKKTDEASRLSDVLAKLNEIYGEHAVSDERKEFLTEQMEKYGYLPYPQYKVLQELTPAETIYCLVEKLVYAKTFVVNKFIELMKLIKIEKNIYPEQLKNMVIFHILNTKFYKN